MPVLSVKIMRFQRQNLYLFCGVVFCLNFARVQLDDLDAGELVGDLGRAGITPFRRRRDFDVLDTLPDGGDSVRLEPAPISLLA